MEPNFKSMDSIQKCSKETIDRCKKYVLMMEKRKEDQEAIIMQAKFDYNHDKSAENKNKCKSFPFIHPTLHVWRRGELSS